MNGNQKIQITINDWACIAKICNTQAKSRLCRPICYGSSAYEYESTIGEFISQNTYMLYYINPANNRSVSWDCPNARPMTFKDFLKCEENVEKYLDKWRELRGPNIENTINPPTKIISLHCKDCNRHVVIDGNHRIVCLGNRKENEHRLVIVELSGQWTKCAIDMSTICICADKPSREFCPSPYKDSFEICLSLKCRSH